MISFLKTLPVISDMGYLMQSEKKAAIHIPGANWFMEIVQSLLCLVCPAILSYDALHSSDSLPKFKAGLVTVTRFYKILHCGFLNGRKEKQPRNHSFSG